MKIFFYDGLCKELSKIGISSPVKISLMLALIHTGSKKSLTRFKEFKVYDNQKDFDEDKASKHVFNEATFELLKNAGYVLGENQISEIRTTLKLGKSAYFENFYKQYRAVNTIEGHFYWLPVITYEDFENTIEGLNLSEDDLDLALDLYQKFEKYKLPLPSVKDFMLSLQSLWYMMCNMTAQENIVAALIKKFPYIVST